MAPDSALPLVEQAIRNATGARFRLAAVEPRSGGDAHRALVVTDAQARYFAKIDAAANRPMFEAEADGLAALRATGSLRVPAVVALAADDRHAVLVLEHLALRPLASAADGEAFGRALARLHAATGEHFGWHRDNFIGRSPQRNTPSDNWSQFVVQCRLTPQIGWARDKGYALPGELDRLLARVPALFLDYRPRPALVHGDLWHGNAGVLDDGAPVIFDPAAHYADADTDLAMCELFGGFPDRTFAAYRELRPLAEGFEQRKLVYVLYHLLNHLNLFGRTYLGEVRRVTERLMREL